MTITLDVARERLKAVVPLDSRNHEDLTSPERCQYFELDGSPSCIIGHAFADELRAAGVEAGTDHNGQGIDFLVRQGLLRIEQDALRYLVGVQTDQDGGMPWAEAVEDAELFLTTEEE